MNKEVIKEPTTATTEGSNPEVLTNGKITLSGIKTPKTVEEFRENLKKYFWSFGTDALYVKTQSADPTGIPYGSINSFDDIYDLTGTGMRGDWTSPSIVPLIVDRYGELVEKFDNPELENEILFYANKEEHMDEGRPEWITLDNQLLRDLFAIVCGHFCGYGRRKTRMDYFV